MSILPTWDGGSGPPRRAVPRRRTALAAAAGIAVLALGTRYLITQQNADESSADAVDVIATREVVTAVPRVEPAGPPPLTAEQVAASLLTPGDVPPAFSIPSDETEPIQATDCPDRDRVEREAAGAPVTGEISFHATDSFGFIRQRIAVHPGRAEAILAEMRRVYVACPVLTYAGKGDNLRVSPLPFPTLGDGTTAVKAEMVTFFGPVTIEAVTFRVGDNLVTVTHGAVGGRVQPGLTAATARAALQRIRRVTGA